jgi:hypothetical protein
MHVSSLIPRERIHRLQKTWHAYFLRPGRDFRKVKTPGEVTWVRVPVRAVPVVRKLSKIEERRQDQSCLRRRGDYRDEGQNHENLSWVRLPVKLVHVPRKLSTTEKTPRTKLFISASRLQKTEGKTAKKMSWVRVVVKAVPLTRKTTVEEQCNDRSCLYRVGY